MKIVIDRVMPLLLGVVWLSGLTNAAAAADQMPEKLYEVGFSPIAEMSGLVKSLRFDDVYWLHNDSGDSARLFAIDGQGKVIYPGFLGVYGEHPVIGKEEWRGHRIAAAANIDWEDIAADDDFLYVAEMGNNGNARRDLGVYVIPEPNPRAVDETRPLKFLPIRYPEQRQYPAADWHYDSEALFIVNQTLYFISKHRENGKIGTFEPGAVLYRLDTAYTDRFNLLQRVDSHDEVTAVTGADISPDGQRLAVLCYLQLWLFDKPAQGDEWLSSRAYKIDLNFTQTGQAEAIAWIDNEQLMLGNEAGEVFSIRADQVPPIR